MGGMHHRRAYHPRRFYRRPMLPRRHVRMWPMWGMGPRLWGIGCMLPIVGIFAMFMAIALLRAIMW